MASSLISQTSFGAAHFYRNDFEINFNLMSREELVLLTTLHIANNIEQCLAAHIVQCC